MSKRRKQKYYTVWIGREPGIYFSWEDCQKQIHGYENAVYKSFNTKEQAESAFNENSNKFIGTDSFETTLSKKELELIGTPVENSICVDGAWNTRTNAMEYQGVMFPKNEKLFHAGPFRAGTNNIAEFLAIVHALTYCKKKPEIAVIYSDSRTAISWVKKKKAATKIETIETTVPIIAIVHRAEDWLRNNDYQTSILKWETSAWGENPADFGRK